MSKSRPDGGECVGRVRVGGREGTTREITGQSIKGPVTIGGITITGTKKDTKKK